MPPTVPTARSCQFGPLLVHFDERVLTPRPWTLHQSQWAAELSAAAPPGPLLELCAGAGHIGLAAAVLADRDLVQVEADPIAAGYARSNAQLAGWSTRTEVRTARLESSLRHEERFGVIIADPPYLRSADVGRWPKDPPQAIDGGDDGLRLLRACLDVAAQHLTEAGHLVLQVAGRRQAEQVARLIEARPTWGLEQRATRVFDQERAVMLISRSTLMPAARPET